MPPIVDAPQASPIQALLALDPWLAPYEGALLERYQRFVGQLMATAGPSGRLTDYANGHLYFGAHPTTDGWVFREAAPAAKALYLIGDFNGWDRRANPYLQQADGTWQCVVHQADLSRPLGHGSRLKIHVISAHGAEDRLSPYAKRVVQDPDSHDFCEELWQPPQPYVWRHAAPLLSAEQPLLIYEAHVGMAQEQAGVGTYSEFRDQVLPRIAKGGYTAVQLMALAEHPYYGSFGYHVANFFAPSSRFGTPDDLKSLIDTAHGLGLAVFMDIVHAHAAANTREGLAGFDGTDHQFFHDGPRGHHPLWGSRLFNYGSPAVCHFLLSNLKAWMCDYRLDGFRFDGVTSMLYRHHGLGPTFDHYDRYFGPEIDDEAVTYLQLANCLIRELRPSGVAIAEDVSGMPGLARPLAEGGLGFDFRLAMGLPDYWFNLVRHQADETWRPSELLRALSNRRHGEKHIAYVESHDQAMVGDKTMAFTLMDQAMYDHMGRTDHSVVVSRGVALHKMIRLMTLSLGGEAYLNFMGNEFGHPEWIDFPREGNGWSYAHARRQWSLADRNDLLYEAMGAFDRAMLLLAKARPWLNEDKVEPLLVDDTRQLLVVRRAQTIFAFNFHPSRSEADLEVGVPAGWANATAAWQIALSSDDTAFGGLGRQDPAVRHPVRDGVVRLYLPCRTAAVYTT